MIEFRYEKSGFQYEKSVRDFLRERESDAKPKNLSTSHTPFILADAYWVEWILRRQMMYHHHRDWSDDHDPVN